jgi:hypothetical protein
VRALGDILVVMAVVVELFEVCTIGNLIEIVEVLFEKVDAGFFLDHCQRKKRLVNLQ